MIDKLAIFHADQTSISITKRQQQKLYYMYNVNTGMVPSNIQDLIPPLVSETSDYPLKNSRIILVPLNRTFISQK